jgi:hypothetical protein
MHILTATLLLGYALVPSVCFALTGLPVNGIDLACLRITQITQIIRAIAK